MPQRRISHGFGSSSTGAHPRRLENCAFPELVPHGYTIQAQRDHFGAHDNERIDVTGTFHTDWAKGAVS
jgi:hypothetical protein